VAFRFLSNQEVFRVDTQEFVSSIDPHSYSNETRADSDNFRQLVYVVPEEVKVFQTICRCNDGRNESVVQFRAIMFIEQFPRGANQAAVPTGDDELAVLGVKQMRFPDPYAPVRYHDVPGSAFIIDTAFCCRRLRG
jgi:hypothetical protein